MVEISVSDSVGLVDDTPKGGDKVDDRESRGERHCPVSFLSEITKLS